MSQTLPERVRWTTADLELLPDDGWKRYEIVDGELFVTKAPHFRHQTVIRNICSVLSQQNSGEAIPNPGVIFSDADNVIPDVVWVSRDRLPLITDEAGHFISAPELIIEVLSPGATNERRDREAKLKLYSSQGVQEYWIVSRELQQVEVYRRENAILKRAVTYLAQDTITSPLLPGFECRVEKFFA
ncbi:Uma2 family endonuclease [Kovacikia minuta CCNUW1]|uniref:Uma2 family endonuclease n=1 Tax=Kovacikia minuta TaxID=2931930 RepID=UPI001CCC001D|nr:Uma2 family endonuclease [Kovacikia minuta]UBF25427.1 Uma2 family endonuclease [Kovacikia minuta CCNUW1]